MRGEGGGGGGGGGARARAPPDTGGGAKDYCLAGWALTRQVLPDLHIGAEIYHQTADMHGGRATTGLGAGATWIDLSDNYPSDGIRGAQAYQNAAETNDRMSWYAAVFAISRFFDAS